MARFRITPEIDSGPVLDRVIEAYGFDQKMQLAQHLDIAQSSLSSRYKRGGLPADIMIKCMADTGVGLEWLATGKGKKFEESEPMAPSIIRKKLINGLVKNDGYVSLDSSLYVAPKREPENAFLLLDGSTHYVIDPDFDDIHDGQWLVDIEGKSSIRTLTRIPVKKVLVEGAGASFDCKLEEITALGRVVLTIN